MKQSNLLPTGRARGVAIRVPPRRIAGASPSCDVIEFTGAIAEPLRSVAWDGIATALPRAARVVLLVAAEDVSSSWRTCPRCRDRRLREALPNLVEDRTVGDVATLHVALGQPVDEPGASAHARVLAVVDRTWLASMQVHVVRAGLRVAAIVPDALTVPKSADAWSLAVTSMEESTPAVSLRRAAQQALSLGADETSAAAIAATVVRTTAEPARPKRFDLYASSSIKARARRSARRFARATNIALHDAGGDPFVAWLEGGGATGTFGPPLSLFASDQGTGALGRSWQALAHRGRARDRARRGPDRRHAMAVGRSAGRGLGPAPPTGRAADDDFPRHARDPRRAAADGTRVSRRCAHRRVATIPVTSARWSRPARASSRRCRRTRCAPSTTKRARCACASRTAR